MNSSTNGPSVSLKQGFRRVRDACPALGLSGQFLVISSIALVVSMAALGAWVADEIEDKVIQNTAVATALYMDSSVAPIVQGLSQSNYVPPNTRKALGKILNSTELGKRVLSFKIWGKNGLVIYSSHGHLDGKTFKVSDNLRSAWGGNVAAELGTHEDEEDKLERQLGVPLLEVYSPIYDENSRQIIVVGEFYADATDLSNDLFRAQMNSWLIVMFLALTTVFVQYHIVRRASGTIHRQDVALEQRVVELSSLLKQNEDLRRRAEAANDRTSEINEQFLRRIGADLHDGPAQLLGLALLRVDSLKSQVEQTTDRTQDIDTVKQALSDALKEIRDLSAGLALPEIEELALAETLKVAVRMHENRTGTIIQSSISPLPEVVRPSIKVCLYRFVQEALNNAFKHAHGHGQRLQTTYNNTALEVVVEDNGEGLSSTQEQAFVSGLGLVGLRERIETLGGEMDVQSNPGKGTKLTARFPIEALELR